MAKEQMTPMMTQQRRNTRTVYYFTDWVISMKCFLMMP